MGVLHALYLKCNSPTFQVRKLKLKNIAYWKHLKQYNPQKQKGLETTTVLAAFLFFFYGKPFVNYQILENKINDLSVAELSHCMVDLSFI